MDKKGLIFHVDRDDYFVTLATVLNFLADEFGRINLQKSFDQVDCLYMEQTLRKVCKELMFLQKNFKITRRPLKSASLTRE